MNNHQIPGEKQFKEIFDRGEKNYQSGDRDASSFFSNEETIFLASIGCKPQELFDFIEDQCNYGEPDFETVLQVAAIRDRYLREMQKRDRQQCRDSIQSTSPQKLKPWTVFRGCRVLLPKLEPK